MGSLTLAGICSCGQWVTRELRLPSQVAGALSWDFTCVHCGEVQHYTVDLTEPCAELPWGVHVHDIKEANDGEPD